MTKEEAVREVTSLVMDVVEEVTGASYMVPVGVSARHIHLTKEHVQALFGKGYQLTLMKRLSQPGQFACAETVELIGPKGSIKKVRILGPERSRSQVEIPYSDSRRLGVTPPIRTSGDLNGTPGIRLKGPAGIVDLDSGVIVADRHIHMTPQDAAWYGVENGDTVRAKVDGPKGGVVDKITVRVDESYKLDLHMDTDDANAFLIEQNLKLQLMV